MADSWNSITSKLVKICEIRVKNLKNNFNVF